MITQFVINLVLAAVWGLLQESFIPATVLTGYLLGAGILYIVARTQREEFYFRRVGKGFELLVVFAVELVVANVRMAYQILHPALPVSPGIIALPLVLRTDGQITLLAAMITMTPGTLSVDVSPDHRYMYIHVLDLDDPEDVKRRIKRLFEQRIAEVS